MNNANKKNIIINIIEAFFISFAWMNIGNLESTNILLVCIFLGSFILLCKKEECLRNVKIASVITAALFAILYALFDDLTGGLENRFFILIYVSFSMLGLFFMFYELLNVILSFAKKKSLKADPKPFSKRILFIYAGLVFVCCLPFFVLDFPAVMTPDSIHQYAQIIGAEPLSNHHPWVHTVIFGLFFNLGYSITHSTYFGIACYSVVQMMLVSFGIAYAIETMYEKGLSKGVRIALLLVFVLLPYNLMYSVTVWKDVLFSVSVLILTVTWMRIVSKFTTRDGILYVISGLGTCLLRHNGFYAFIISALILLIAMRKQIRPYLICSSLILLIAVIVRVPVARACNVLPDDSAYAMCVPLEQFGRVIYNERPLTDEQRRLIEKIGRVEDIRATYSPQGADPMTSWVIEGDSEYFHEHLSEYGRLWLRLGLTYPVDYLVAFRDLTMGYWAPMNPQQTVFFGITEYGYDLHSSSLTTNRLSVKICELIYKFYTMIPVYGTMYSMGAFFWLLIICVAICILNKKKHRILPMLPVIFIHLSLFAATPLAADLRYAYALMIALPYIIVYCLSDDSSSI